MVPSSGAFKTWAPGPSLCQCFSWKPAPQAQPYFLSPSAHCCKAELLDRGRGSDTCDGRPASIPRIVSSPRVMLGAWRASTVTGQAWSLSVTCGSGGWDSTPWASSALPSWESHVPMIPSSAVHHDSRLNAGPSPQPEDASGGSSPSGTSKSDANRASSGGGGGGLMEEMNKLLAKR